MRTTKSYLIPHSIYPGMGCVTGQVYHDGRFFKGYVEFGENGNRFGQGIREDAIASGIIIPKFVNCHTHLGDAFVPRPESASVEELVAPPNGLKHRMLREVSEEEQVEHMRRAILGMAASGTSHFIDFREGGSEGARRLLKAAMGINLRPVIFGRPKETRYHETETDSLLPTVDGIGVSAINDWDLDELRQLSEHTRSSGKPFALHASETVREDIEAILDLEPTFLVHMIAATDADLEACSATNVPIVICPTANDFFGLRPPLERMMKADVQVCLGTDNAMLASPDMFSELRKTRAVVSKDVVSDASIFEMTFDNGRKVLNSILGLGAEDGEYPEFLVLDGPMENPLDMPMVCPWETVMKARAEDIYPYQCSASGELVFEHEERGDGP